jgi:hypothetical protein
VLGTHVVKVFDLAAARTGLRDADALHAGFDPCSEESGAILGACLANLMCHLPAVTMSTTTRGGWRLLSPRSLRPPDSSHSSSPEPEQAAPP